MKKKASCPACGTRLSKLHDPNMWRTCNACNRTNPRKYPYCGWCASPMENTEMRKKLSEVAAPPGGWPSLASELVEVRFFMERGNFADAFELLAILRQRYPLHPELDEFTESTRPSLAADTDVHQVVDGVLADSSSLSGTAVGRRPAPKWNAPQAKGGGDDMTGSHTTVPSDEFDDVPAPTPRRRGAGKRTRRGHQPIAAVPVVPIIPPGARIATPKKKRKGKKKRLMTHRYERAEGPQQDEPQEIQESPVAEEEATVQVDAPQEEAPVAEAGVPVAIEERPLPQRRPAPVAEATPNLIEPGERASAHAAGQFMVTDVVPHVPAEPMAEPQQEREPVPRPARRSDTEPLDTDDIEEVGGSVVQVEPEPEPVDPHAEQIAAAKRAGEKRARRAARRAAAEQREKEAAAEAARLEAAAARLTAQRQAKQRRDDEAVEAARLAVEEAVSDLTEPEARTGRTHVGAPPEEPAVTGNTAVGEPPAAAPAVTGNTAVGAPPEEPMPPVADEQPGEVVHRSAPEVRVETAVGPPPSAEPGYVPPKGLTLAVEALQPAKPFDEPEPEARKRKKKLRGQARKRSMKPRKRSGKLASVNTEQQEAERQERARRRAARFGQGILGK